MPHALGAQRRIDHVDGLALRDRLVRAGRLADVAIDAELVDLQGHGRIVSAAPAAGVAAAEHRCPWTTKPARCGLRRDPRFRGDDDLAATPALRTWAVTSLGFDEHVFHAGRLDGGLDALAVGGVADVQHAHALHGVRGDGL